MTRETAFKKTIKVWRSIVKNNGLPPHPPTSLMNGMKGPTFLCHVYYGKVKDCAGCPLNQDTKSYKGCMQDGHPVREWIRTSNKETAQKMLDFVTSKI